MSTDAKIGLRKTMINEANCWFHRNLEAIKKQNGSHGARIISGFLSDFMSKEKGRIERLLEIGCSWGYNLNFWADRLNIKCVGIDPSDEAVQYGRNKWGEGITLIQGMSDMLPFEDESFDVVILGFCLYQVPWAFLNQTMNEADRVLKQGGFLSITDFDTQIPYIRDNQHNDKMPVFKQDYSRDFISNGYFLVKKESYSSDGGQVFDPEIQRRVSTQILYKEPYNTKYVRS